LLVIAAPPDLRRLSDNRRKVKFRTYVVKRSVLKG
jgi:hypothetical protein